MGRCERCLQTKSAESFYPKRSRTSGLSAWCIACTLEYRRERRGLPEQSEGYLLGCEIRAIEEALDVLDPDAEWIGLLEWDAMQTCSEYARTISPQR